MIDKKETKKSFEENPVNGIEQSDSIGIITKGFMFIQLPG